MKYTFPNIEHVDQVLAAISGKTEFYVKRDEVNGHLIVNYHVNFAETFPAVETENDAILRECRGIVFDLKSGKIVSRPHAKFFNIGEKVETRVEALDFTKSHVILEKLDGSMVRPLIVNDKVVFGTKMGVTDVAAPITAFANRGIAMINDVKTKVFYTDFCFDLMESGYTPIFEWCSRVQKIVVDYPHDMLVLTSVRKTMSGQVLSMDQMHALADPYRVPVVKAFDLNAGDTAAFMQYVAGVVGMEGFVIRFADGHMVKVKADDYLTRHRVKDNLSFEKNVVQMIASENWDDALGFLDTDARNAVQKFADNVHRYIAIKADELFWIAQAAHDNFNGSKKRFAIEVVNVGDNQKWSGILFKTWDNLDGGVDFTRKLIIDTLKNSTSSQGKVDDNRHLLNNLRWDMFYMAQDVAAD